MKGKTVIFNHPLINHKLSLMRNETTGTKDFRQTLSEIGMLMAYEITRDLPTKEVLVKTPVAIAKCQELAKEVVIVPILRAGLGMVDGITALIPTAKVGHIGLYRDEETLEPKEYYAKFPWSLKWTRNRTAWTAFPKICNSLNVPMTTLTMLTTFQMRLLTFNQ